MEQRYARRKNNQPMRCEENHLHKQISAGGLRKYQMHKPIVCYNRFSLFEESEEVEIWKILKKICLPNNIHSCSLKIL